MTHSLTPADVLDRVADLLPSVSDPAVLADAAAWFAAQLNVEAFTPHTVPLPDARAFDGRRGGGVPDMPAVAVDTVGRHTVRRGRSKNGPTVLVTHRGTAPVIGRMDVDANGIPLIATPAEGSPDVAVWSWQASQMLARAAQSGDLRRVPGGWSSRDVAHITDQASSLDDLMPRRLGTDDLAYEETIRCDRSTVARGAMRPNLTDDTDRETIAAMTGVYMAQTARLAWRTRYALRRGKPRKGDPTTRTVVAVRTIRHAPDRTKRTTVRNRQNAYVGSGLVPFSHVAPITMLSAPAADPDHMWIGHDLVPRPVTRHTAARRTAATRRNQARDIGTVPAPATATGWAELLEHLNRGERVIATHDAGRIRITRAKSGRYSAGGLTIDGAPVAIKSARTAQSVATILATA